MVSRVELQRAIAMIAKRRRKVDDPNRYLLPDDENSDPREILDYLQRYSSSGIPLWVLQADVCDALTLNNWLWWTDRRRELHFLQAGRNRGLFLSQIGAQVGVSKQGVLDRIDRLEALLKYDRPDEKLTRAARRAKLAAEERRPFELNWLASRRGRLTVLIAALTVEADRYELAGDDREWIDELAQDSREGLINRATLPILGMAASELRTAPAVLALDSTRPSRIHALLNQVDSLRSEFAGLAARRPSPASGD